MFTKFRDILEMIRFSHTVFALPFALLAAVMAWTTPLPRMPISIPDQLDLAASIAFRGQDLLGILMCMVCARSAAMAFNRIVDRDLDARNPRTAGRHLVTGALSVRSAVVFTVISAGGFVVSTLLFLPNRWPLFLSVPVLAWLLSYSFAKRFTVLVHFWLGGALMLSPICVWLALRGEVVLIVPTDILPAVWLGTVVLLWVGGFDIIYACQDFAHDRSCRLKSVPAKLGVATALKIACACHLSMIAVLAGLPLACPQLHLGWIFCVGLVAVAGLLVYEHLLVRPDDLDRVNIAFFQINAVISLGLLGVVTLDLFV